MFIRKVLCALIICFGIFEVHAEEACDIPLILSPTHTDIGNAKPRFEWTQVANAKRYRLWLESRLPEGRVLMTHDIQTTSTNWTPPAALTETRALLKVKLFAICKEGNDENADMRVTAPFTRYRIDVSSSCILPTNPVVKVIDQHVEVNWPSVEGANYYELMAYSGIEATLVRRSKVKWGQTRLIYAILRPLKHPSN